MPTPYGHALAGGILYLLVNRGAPRLADAGRILLYAGLAAAADLDLFLDLWVGEPGRFHHGISHSLGMAALVGMGAAVLTWKSGPSFLGVFAAVFSLYASHVLLDYLAVDTREPFGLMALWPFSGAYYLSPVSVFLDVWRWPVSGEMVRHNILAVVRETLILFPALAVLFYVRRRSGRSLSDPGLGGRVVPAGSAGEGRGDVE